jgi:serine/threonine protein phosphatase PrpC
VLFRSRLHAVARQHADSPSREARTRVLQALDDVCQQATRRIYETAETENKKGMTTTLVVTLMAGNTCFLAHVGDSRAYLFRGGLLHQLTEDHSMVNELVRTGKMTLAEARASKHRHVITRALGLYPNVQPSLATIDLMQGDRLLLCSDGLTDVVVPDGILACGSIEDPNAATAALIQEALDNGGPDNVTVVLVDPGVHEEPDAAEYRARILETLFLFEDMPYAARLQVAELLNLHLFKPGDIIVQQGARDNAMYVVLEGQVSVRSRHVELARLNAGEHFGELSLDRKSVV